MLLFLAFYFCRYKVISVGWNTCGPPTTPEGAVRTADSAPAVWQSTNSAPNNTR